MATKTKATRQWSREAIAKLSPAEFDQHRDSIVKWMQAGGSSGSDKPRSRSKAPSRKGRAAGASKGKKPLSRKLIASMSDAEYEARRDEIVEWINNGGGVGDPTRPTAEAR